MELLSVIMGVLGGSQIILLLLVPFLILLFVLIALIDVLKHDFNGNDKIVWVLVVILLPVLGAILYFLIGANQKIKETK